MHHSISVIIAIAFIMSHATRSTTAAAAAAAGGGINGATEQPAVAGEHAYAAKLVDTNLGQGAASFEKDVMTAFGLKRKATVAQVKEVFDALAGPGGPVITLKASAASNSRTLRIHYVHALASHYKCDAKACKAAYDAALRAAAADFHIEHAGFDPTKRPRVHNNEPGPARCAQGPQLHGRELLPTAPSARGTRPEYCRDTRTGW